MDTTTSFDLIELSIAIGLIGCTLQGAGTDCVGSVSTTPAPSTFVTESPARIRVRLNAKHTQAMSGVGCSVQMSVSEELRALLIRLMVDEREKIRKTVKRIILCRCYSFNLIQIEIEF